MPGWRSSNTHPKVSIRFSSDRHRSWLCLLSCCSWPFQWYESFMRPWILPLHQPSSPSFLLRSSSSILFPSLFLDLSYLPSSAMAFWTNRKGSTERFLRFPHSFSLFLLFLLFPHSVPHFEPDNLPRCYKLSYVPNFSLHRDCERDFISRTDSSQRFCDISHLSGDGHLDLCGYPRALHLWACHCFQVQEGWFRRRSFSFDRSY